MHILPTILLLEIILIIFLCLNRYKDNIISIIGGGMGIILILTLLIGTQITPAREYKKIDEVKITTLQDDIYLTAEQPHNTLLYEYKPIDKDKTDYISAEDTKIYESKNNYRIETWKYRKQFLFVYYDNIVYKIYIPSTGNIKYEKDN